MGSVTRTEIKQVVLWSAAVMLVTCLPYLFGILITPPGWHFMGYVHNPDDPNAYLAWARQAQEGRLLLEDKFTTEPQRALFFNLFLLALGRGSALLHIPLIWMYHIARVVGGFALLVMVYLFAAMLSDRPAVRHTAFFLAAFSSGFGWLVVVLGGGSRGLRPVDFNPTGLVMPEAITFLSIYLLPLFALSMALMVSVIYLYLLSLERGRVRYALAGGILFGILANVHTYDVITIAGVLVVYTVVEGVRRKRFPAAEALSGLVVGLFAVPAVSWQWYVMQADAAYRQKAMTPTLSLGLADHAVSYGIVLLLALVGLPRLVRAGRAGVLAVCWLVVGWMAFMWGPFPFQRKLAEGLHIPMCGAAAVGLIEVLLPRLGRVRGETEAGGDARKKSNSARAWVIAAVIGFSALSNVAFVRVNLMDLVTNNQRQLQHAMPPFYLTDDDLQAMRWLADNTDRNDTVLASPWIANYIPGQSGNRVLAGHWAETIGFADLLADVVRPFYDSRTSVEDRRMILRRYPIRIVYFGPWERLLTGGDPLPPMPELQQAYANNQVTLYRVLR